MVRGHPETGSVRLVGVLMGFGESDQVARYQYSSAVYSCRSPVGYFDQFPPTSLSVGCRFGHRTFAGATRMERMRRFWLFACHGSHDQADPIPACCLAVRPGQDEASLERSSAAFVLEWGAICHCPACSKARSWD